MGAQSVHHLVRQEDSGEYRDEGNRGYDGSSRQSARTPFAIELLEQWIVGYAGDRSRIQMRKSRHDNACACAGDAFATGFINWCTKIYNRPTS